MKLQTVKMLLLRTVAKNIFPMKGKGVGRREKVKGG